MKQVAIKGEKPPQTEENEHNSEYTYDLGSY